METILLDTPQRADAATKRNRFIAGYDPRRSTHVRSKGFRSYLRSLWGDDGESLWDAYTAIAMGQAWVPDLSRVLGASLLTREDGIQMVMGPDGVLNPVVPVIPGTRDRLAALDVIREYLFGTPPKTVEVAITEPSAQLPLHKLSDDQLSEYLRILEAANAIAVAERELNSPPAPKENNAARDRAAALPSASTESPPSGDRESPRGAEPSSDSAL